MTSPHSLDILSTYSVKVSTIIQTILLDFPWKCSVLKLCANASVARGDVVRDIACLYYKRIAKLSSSYLTVFIVDEAQDLRMNAFENQNIAQTAWLISRFRHMETPMAKCTCTCTDLM